MTGSQGALDRGRYGAATIPDGLWNGREMVRSS
jgi:hypothetical protein